MTRDGAFEENRTTGDIERISKREADAVFSRPQDTAQPMTPQPGELLKPPLPLLHGDAQQDTGVADRVFDRLDTERSRSKNKHAVKRANELIRKQAQEPEQPRSSSRLQFTTEERTDPALFRHIRKSDAAADKLDAARNRIPKQKKPVIQRTFDEQSGKSKVRLRFEDTGKKPVGKMRHSPIDRPAQELGGAVHSEIHKVEHENAGVEGAHKAEQLAERGGGYAVRKVKEGYRSHKLKHYRAAAKAEEKAFKANVNVRYQRALRDNPQLAASNPLSKFMQKQKIRRDYAKAVRNGTVRGARGAAATAKKTAKTATKSAQKTGAFITRHSKGFIIAIAAILIFVLLFAGLSSCGSMFTGVLNTITTTTYPSKEQDMLAVEAAYSGLETGLQNEVDSIETTYPGYDEYRYTLDNIGHDPHKLAAYLSAVHMGYTLDDVRQELNGILGLQYKLTLTETIEVRYRTETRTDADGNTYTVQVPYNYYILNVKLENRGLDYVAQSTLNPEQLEMYNIYQETKGNMPLLFGGGSMDTSPGEDLSGVQFVDGTRPGNPAVVEIAKSQVGNVGGQPYWSWYGFNSRVEWCACFVSWCYNQAGYSEPCFAACTSQGMPWFQSRGQWGDRNYSQIAPGDAIFFDWDGDGSADHVGIVIGTDGEKVYTVEGNSGDACKIRSYPLGSSVIRGYGLMNW